MSESTPPTCGGADCGSMADAVMPSVPPSPAPVPSPCIDVCAIDPRTGWCAGCLRTLDEIAAWGSLDNAGKRTVWKKLHQRRATLEREGAQAAGAQPERGAPEP